MIPLVLADITTMAEVEVASLDCNIQYGNQESLELSSCVLYM